MVGRGSKRDSSQKIFYTVITLRSNMTESRQETHRAVWSIKVLGSRSWCYVDVFFYVYLWEWIYSTIKLQFNVLMCCVQFRPNCTTSITDLDITNEVLPQTWYTASSVYSDESSRTTCKWILNTDIMVVYDDLPTALHVLLHYIQHSHLTSELSECIF